MEGYGVEAFCALSNSLHSTGSTMSLHQSKRLPVACGKYLLRVLRIKMPSYHLCDKTTTLLLYSRSDVHSRRAAVILATNVRPNFISGFSAQHLSPSTFPPWQRDVDKHRIWSRNLGAIYTISCNPCSPCSPCPTDSESAGPFLRSFDPVDLRALKIYIISMAVNLGLPRIN